MTIKETAHYKLYDNIVLTPLANMGVWTKTDIHIPDGAIVAVMVKGQIWDIWEPHKYRWQPYRCLRFKVGKKGMEREIISGTDLRNRSTL